MIDELIHRIPPSVYDPATERYGLFYFQVGNAAGTHWRAGYKSDYDNMAYAELQIEGDNPADVLRELYRRVITHQIAVQNSVLAQGHGSKRR